MDVMKIKDKNYRELCSKVFRLYFSKKDNYKNYDRYGIREKTIWQHVDDFFNFYAPPEIKGAYYLRWRRKCGKTIFELKLAEIETGKKQDYPVYDYAIDEYIEEYILHYGNDEELNIYIDQILSVFPVKKQQKITQLIFEKITELKDVKRIYEFLDKIDISYIRGILSSKRCNSGLTPFILNSITSYLNSRSEEKVEKKDASPTNEENTEKAVCIINYVLNNGVADFSILPSDSPYNKNDYVWARLFLKKINHPLYTTYINYVDDYKRQRYERLKPLIDEMLYYINNGIVQNGVKRSFDIIDYYDMIPIRIDIFFNIVREYLTAEENRKLKVALIEKYDLNHKSLLSAVTEKILYEPLSIIFNYNDEVLMISSEECENAFNELKARGILNSMTYKVAINRLKQQKISELLEKEKQLVK